MGYYFRSHKATGKGKCDCMLTLTGKKVFQGISIGPLIILKSKSTAEKFYVVADVEAEVARFHTARKTAIRQLSEIYQIAVNKVGLEEAAVFDVHQMMLEDLDYIESVERIINDEKCNAEFAVGQTAQSFSEMFAAMDDEYMKGRAADVVDISSRVIDVLSGHENVAKNDYNKVIIAADDLAPSETLQLDTDNILGFVTAEGSTSSHTAILARTLGIAAVVKTGVHLGEEFNGKLAVIDGFTGTVYVDPDEETLAKMKELKRENDEISNRLEKVRGKASITLDGQEIEVFANVGNPKNIPGVLENDAEGIGLFRSEFLYLESKDYPTEEQQFNAYKEVAVAMNGKKIVIRTMDIGADKQADYFKLNKEENPALGLRAIRICLSRPELFKTQLRAILRASAFGKIAIMFPMIISRWEILKSKELLGEVISDLQREKIDFDDQVEVGIMIETPAAAVMSDVLAQEVDFFSIGTNDLTQYTLAIDRQGTELDMFFDPHHPAVLRLIEQTVQNGHKAGIWVGICGELGADLELTETFLRMGVDELSVSAPAILPLREKIRSLNLRKN